MTLARDWICAAGASASSSTARSRTGRWSSSWPGAGAQVLDRRAVRLRVGERRRRGRRSDRGAGRTGASTRSRSPARRRSIACGRWRPRRAEARLRDGPRAGPRRRHRPDRRRRARRARRAHRRRAREGVRDAPPGQRARRGAGPARMKMRAAAARSWRLPDRMRTASPPASAAVPVPRRGCCAGNRRQQRRRRHARPDRLTDGIAAVPGDPPRTELTSLFSVARRVRRLRSRRRDADRLRRHRRRRRRPLHDRAVRRRGHVFAAVDSAARRTIAGMQPRVDARSARHRALSAALGVGRRRPVYAVAELPWPPSARRAGRPCWRRRAARRSRMRCRPRRGRSRSWRPRSCSPTAAARPTSSSCWSPPRGLRHRAGGPARRDLAAAVVRAGHAGCGVRPRPGRARPPPRLAALL